MEDITKETPEEEIPFKERFRQMIVKITPYIKNVWEFKWKIIIANGIMAVIVAGLLLLFAGPYYDTSVSILPEYGTQSSAMAQFGGLASLAGVSLGGGSSTAIYQKLVTSESVLKPVIYKKYKTEAFKDSVNLIDYYEIQPDESLPKDLRERGRLLAIYRMLVGGKLTTILDATTNVLSITVRMPEPELSAAVSNEITKSLDQYVRTQRQSTAKEQLIYVQDRINQVKDSLNIAENALEEFQKKNRSVQNPGLVLEQNRLQRTVNILNSVYLQLNQQLELAKIDVIKDAPVINLMEHAGTPIMKTGPPRTTIFIFLMFFIFVLVCAFYGFRQQITEYKTITFSHIRDSLKEN